MVHGRYLVDILLGFLCLVTLFQNHIEAQQNIVYFARGESVTLVCKVNPTSWCTWDGPSVDGGEFTTYSDSKHIDQSLPNADRLEIVGNISLGEYNLHISDASVEDEGAYRCSIVDEAAKQTHVILQMKVQPSNITVNGANKRVLNGIEGRQLVLNCSVKSGIPEESILWYNGSLLLGRGGPRIFTMSILPQIYDHRRTLTCIANSSALKSPLNITIMLNIKYRPVLTLNADKPFRRLSNTDQNEIHVDEGQHLTIACLVDSNPPASEVNFNRFKSAKSPYILELINITKDDKGLYECRANNSLGETYKSVIVIVQYPPSISISKYLENMELRCCPEGKPENYTFHHWLHHSELGKLIRQLSSKEIIRLKAKDNNTRKYELNGMYSCRVDNGVKDVNGKLIQSKRVLVMQEDQPRFVSENKQNQYGQFGEAAFLEVSVYSHPTINRLEVLRNRTCCLKNSEYIHVENTTINDHIFGKEVQLAGYRITVRGFKLKETDFTSYEFRIRNAVNSSSFVVNLNAAGDEKITSQTSIMTMVYTATVIGSVIIIIGITMSALWCIKKGRQLKDDLFRAHEEYELGSQVDLAVENSMYQSNNCPLQNQSSQNENNVTNHRTGLLSSTDDQTMYHNSVNPIRHNDSQMTVENCMYKEGACGSNNVHIKIPNRKIFKNQNVHATTGEHGASGKSTRNKRNSSTGTTNDTQIEDSNSMNYAEMVFDDRSPGQEGVIHGSADRTIYAGIDITAVGTQLPDIDEEDDDDDFMSIDGIVDYRKSLNMLNVVK